MSRLLVVLLCLAPIAGLTGLFVYRLGQPAYHAFDAAEARSAASVLERAAEQDEQFLGVSSKASFCDARAAGSNLPLASGQERFVYAWVECDEIRRVGRNLGFGSGISVETRFTVIGRGSDLTVRNIEIPGDGTDYGPDLRRMFPKQARRRFRTLGQPVPACENLRAARERWHLPKARAVDAVEPSTPSVRCRQG